MQHLLQIRKTCGNPEAFAKLFSHEQFSIAKTSNLAIRDAMDRVHMLIGDFSAADERDTQSARG